MRVNSSADFLLAIGKAKSCRHVSHEKRRYIGAERFILRRVTLQLSLLLHFRESKTIKIKIKAKIRPRYNNGKFEIKATLVWSWHIISELLMNFSGHPALYLVTISLM